MKAILGFLAAVFLVGMTAAAIIAAAVIQLAVKLLPLLAVAAVALVCVRLFGRRMPAPTPPPPGVTHRVLPPAAARRSLPAPPRGAPAGPVPAAGPPRTGAAPAAGKWMLMPMWVGPVPRPPVIDAEVIDEDDHG